MLSTARIYTHLYCRDIYSLLYCREIYKLHTIALVNSLKVKGKMCNKLFNLFLPLNTVLEFIV